MTRRILCSVLLFCLCAPLLFACAKELAGLDAEEIGERVEKSLAWHDFDEADEDFIKSNFEFGEKITDGAVFLAESGYAREFGVFLVREGEEQAVIDAINAYLEKERAAVEALSHLYPSEELQEILARYDASEIERYGSAVAYFLLPPAEVREAKKAFVRACRGE